MIHVPPSTAGAVLLAAALLAPLGCATTGPGSPSRPAAAFEAEAARPSPLRVLMLSTPQDAEHREAIAASREAMKGAEASSGLLVDTTSDPGALTPQNLGRYDVLFLANALLGMRRPVEETDTAKEGLASETQRAAIAGFVDGGGGLAVAHTGLDSFHRWDAYREMVGGGLLEEHPWTQEVRLNVEDRGNAAVTHLGESFRIRDQIYVLDRNPRWNGQVLLSLDMPSVGVDPGSADQSRDDHPVSWIRRHGKGRVFVTTLGHFAEVWRHPGFARHVSEGLLIAGGRVPADFGGRMVKETISDRVWPDDLAVDEQGDVWIAELTGKIYRYRPGGGEPRLVAELPTTNPLGLEHGLYGLEVDPNFYRGEPYVYAYYAERETFINTLSRFTYRDGALDRSTEKVLLRVPTEPACCHQGGDLEWGPGQTLFVSTGDNGKNFNPLESTGETGVRETEITEARIARFVERHGLTGHHWSRLADSERTSQNLQELRGKIIRINKDGTIPRDNPFFGKPGIRWEIYAYGLRNPFRIKYDAPTGRLYLGVVGPDEATTYDWFNVSVGGENFGWPRASGRLFYNEWTPERIPGYAPPIWEYTYAGGGRSAVMGPIYRHRGEGAFPAVFHDRVFVLDWARKWIKWAEVEEHGTFESDTAAEVKREKTLVRIPALRLRNIKTFDVLGITNPISMELGPDGCLYLAEFAGYRGPGEGSNLSRYCWVRDAGAPAIAGSPPPAPGPP